MSDGLFGSFFGPIFGNNQRTDVTTVKTVHEIVQRDDAEITRLRAENEKLRAALKPFADLSSHWEGDKMPLEPKTITIDPLPVLYAVMELRCPILRL